MEIRPWSGPPLHGERTGNDVWTRWPSAGDLTPEVSVDRLHTVSVTLADTASDPDEMLAILRARLASFHLLVAHDRQGRTILVLTVETDDIWLAVLTAMNGVTATGYVPAAVTAEPAGEYARQARDGMVSAP
jgi:hypothetical protein